MITPVELQGKTFKSGLGYDKKDVDKFLKEVLEDFEALYKDNLDLNQKIESLEEKNQYYKSIEKTLQKALILAEKTVEETKNSAMEKAKVIVDKANLKADSILKDVKDEQEAIHKQTIDIIRQYEIYKAQFKELAKAQCELLESDAFQIQIGNLKTFISEENKENEATDSNNITDNNKEADTDNKEPAINNAEIGVENSEPDMDNNLTANNHMDHAHSAKNDRKETEDRKATENTSDSSDDFQFFDINEDE
jgi:cell division initiation protein